MALPVDLADLIALFEALEPVERLEVLTDYVGRLPVLDPAWHAARDAGLHLVPECQSPVFFMVLKEGDRVRIVADAPVEAPVVRGFVGMLVALFDGATHAEIESAPEDLLAALGLDAAVGMRRRHGLGAVYRRLKATA